MIPLIVASSMLSCGNVQINAGQVEYSRNSFSLSNKVEIVIPEKGTLTCTTAYVDTDNNKLILEGSPHNKVTYVTPDFTITCHRVTAIVDQKASSIEAVQDLFAEGNVQISYKGIVTAMADTGHYQKNQIVLAPHDASGSCRLFHQRGDSVESKTITFDLKEKVVTLAAPNGVIATEPNETRFKANKLTWDMDSNMLTLKEDIHIAQEDLGTLLATESLEIRQDEHNKLRTITAVGKIAVSMANNQTLSCVGSFAVDNEHQTLTIQGAPIVFRDMIGEIETESALINYEDCKPTLITLAKNIRIQNFATVDKIVSDTCLHYIITDHATLNPITKTLNLSSDPNSRTLLYDTVNNIQVSAKSLTVQRDGTSKKDTIKGHGDVRFSFSEKEFNHLKQQFKMLKDAEQDTPKS